MVLLTAGGDTTHPGKARFNGEVIGFEEKFNKKREHLLEASVSRNSKLKWKPQDSVSRTFAARCPPVMADSSCRTTGNPSLTRRTIPLHPRTSEQA
jgi:hypothetical protein